MSDEKTVPVVPTVRELGLALAEPFDPSEVKFKPQMVKDNRCLAMCYIDARLIQDRLDAVMSAVGWEDTYEVLNDGCVICRLVLKFPCEPGGFHAVTHEDVGSPSEQPDGGDRLKAAFSDALKRAAVKFGIGRYLYRVKSGWVDYDPVKKQIVRPPQLPDWALPYAMQKTRYPQAAGRVSRGVQEPAKEPVATVATAPDPIAEWEVRLSSCAGIAQLNEIIPAVGSITNPTAKRVVWARICGWATERGADWDGRAKKFYVDAPADASKTDPKPEPARTT